MTRRHRLLLILPPSGLLVLLSLYLLGSLLCGLISLEGQEAAEGEASIDLYLRSNGVHTDLILPRRALDIDWSQRLDGLPLAAGTADFLAFGWGDREFYLATPGWGDLKLSTALRALTGFDGTVLHVESLSPPTSGPRTRHLRVSARQYRQLAAFVNASFATAEGESAPASPIPAAHYNDHDSFFVARGHYSLFVTCNEWARQGLAAAEVRRPLWSPFDWALFHQLPTPDAAPSQSAR